MSVVQPERITQARLLKGLTKKEVAVRLGVSPAAVAQWESGVKSPTSENLAGLAKELGFPISAFQQPMPAGIQASCPLSFRAPSKSTTKRLNQQSEEFAKSVAELYAWMREKVSLPEADLIDIPTAAVTPEQAAEQCRRAWNLSDRPIRQLGELLESKGIILVKTKLGNTKADAFSCVIGRQPFIFLGSSKKDKARTRFDAAHELAHLILHQDREEKYLSDSEDHQQMEQEANAFASAFLMPRNTFSKEVFDTTLNGFLRLKERWGVSVQAMVVRAKDLGLIDKQRMTELYRQMSAKGWRKARGEPLDDMVPNTNPTVGSRCIALLKEHNIIEPWEIAAENPVPTEILCDAFGIEVNDLELPFKPALRLLS